MLKKVETENGGFLRVTEDSILRRKPANIAVSFQIFPLK